MLSGLFLQFYFFTGVIKKPELGNAVISIGTNLNHLLIFPHPSHAAARKACSKVCVHNRINFYGKFYVFLHDKIA